MNLIFSAYYQWVRKESSMVSSQPSLPQNDSKVRSQWRKRHLGYFQSLIPWKVEPLRVCKKFK